MAMQPEDSVRKKRRTIQFGGSSAAAAGLRDCDDEGERQRLREDELGRRIHNASTCAAGPTDPPFCAHSRRFLMLESPA